jgi:hypothetical protein
MTTSLLVPKLSTRHLPHATYISTTHSFPIQPSRIVKHDTPNHRNDDDMSGIRSPSEDDRDLDHSSPGIVRSESPSSVQRPPGTKCAHSGSDTREASSPSENDTEVGGSVQESDASSQDEDFGEFGEDVAIPQYLYQFDGKPPPADGSFRSWPGCVPSSTTGRILKRKWMRSLTSASNCSRSARAPAFLTATRRSRMSRSVYPNVLVRTLSR